MMAFGLTKMLLSERKHSMGKPGSFLEKEIPRCLVEILWTSDEEFKERKSKEKDKKDSRRFCSKISPQLGKQIRKLMMIILNKDIPNSFFQIKWENYAESFMKSGLIKNITELAMTKAVLPMAPKDVEELVKPIFSFVRGIEKTEIDGSSKSILKLLTSIIDFIDNDNNYKLLADIVQDVQRVIMFKYELDHLLDDKIISDVLGVSN